jgi:DsbC/DsbD-like thiol-disulfide interchange protein
MLEPNSVKDDTMLSIVFFRPRSVVLAAMLLSIAALATETADAQQPQFGTSPQTSDGAQQAMPLNGAANQVAKQKGPWQLSSRIHLEKGTNKGYLVLQVDLQEGYHVYSINPEGSPLPSKIAMSPSADIRMVSKFESDKPPIVIEKDPVFQRRIEKHKGKVQFFASIEVRPGVDLKKLTSEVTFTGQICSKDACQLVRGKKVAASFAGHFEMPAGQNKAGQTAKGNQPAGQTTNR